MTLKHLVLSANITISELVTTSGMSLIYKRNKIGPSIDPCGTPEPTLVHEEWVPFITTRCLLSALLRAIIVILYIIQG